jgi:hypothetical protein
MVWMGVLVLLGLACGPQQPAQTEPVAVTAPYLGSWVVALSDEEQRRQTVYQIALQDTAPGEPELRTMGLEDEDLETLRQLRALPRDAPQMVGIAEVLGQMSGILIITEDEMRMEIGVRQESDRWSVLEQQGGTLTVAFEKQGEGSIRLEDDGSLVLIDNEGQELSFVRESR